MPGIVMETAHAGVGEAAEVQLSSARMRADPYLGRAELPFRAPQEIWNALTVHTEGRMNGAARRPGCQNLPTRNVPHNATPNKSACVGAFEPDRQGLYVAAVTCPGGCLLNRVRRYLAGRRTVVITIFFWASVVSQIRSERAVEAAKESAMVAEEHAETPGERGRQASDPNPAAAASDQPDASAARRENELGRREWLADERDRIADDRDTVANHREQLADEREKGADEREGTAAQRELDRIQRAEDRSERKRAGAQREQSDISREMADSERRVADDEVTESEP